MFSDKQNMEVDMIELGSFVSPGDPDWLKEEVSLFQGGSSIVTALTGLGIVAAYSHDPQPAESWMKEQDLSCHYPEILRGISFRLQHIMDGMSALLEKKEGRDEEWKVAFHTLTLVRDNLMCLVYILRNTDVEIPRKQIYLLDVTVGTAVAKEDPATLR